MCICSIGGRGRMAPRSRVTIWTPSLQCVSSVIMINDADVRARVNGQSLCLETFVEETPEPEVDALDNHRRAPLHIAATNGHADCVSVLLDTSASVNMLDPRGRTGKHNRS